MAQIEDLKTPEELQAAARSRLYQLFARAFTLPNRTFHRRVRNGSLAADVASNVGSLPYPLGAEKDAALTEAGASYQEL